MTTEQTVDVSRVGKKGFPRHYQAFGFEPPMTDVVVAATPDVSPPAPPAEPSTNPLDWPLKRWQFKAMIDVLEIGQQVEDAITAITDPMQRAIAKARYDNSDVYNRADPLFDQLGSAVGLTPADIDAAWMQIATATGGG